MPPDVARGVLQSWRQERLVRRGDSYAETDANDPNGLPLTAVPEARALVTLRMTQSELGQFTLDGNSGFFIPSSTRPSGIQMMLMTGNGPYGVGMSPAVLRPDNRAANARWALDPALRVRISLQPQPSCRSDRDRDPAADRERSARALPEPKITTADVLEALHRATGMPIVADFYTRLYKPEAGSVKNQPLFDALNQVADALRLRWSKDAGTRGAGAWLQFRSASYYHDRLKEVPNRFLIRWAAARRQDGVLPLDQLVEMVQLSGAQLDASEMAEGIRDCFGLIEWDMARRGFTRLSLRFVAQLTPAQRTEALSAEGLAFTRMSLAQQQQFIAALYVQAGGMQSLEELAGATMHIVYTRPGGYQWAAPLGQGRPHREPRELSLVWERTRDAALQAAHRLNPQVEAAEIAPTELALTFLYTWGSSKAGSHHGFAVRATPIGSSDW